MVISENSEVFLFSRILNVYHSTQVKLDEYEYMAMHLHAHKHISKTAYHRWSLKEQFTLFFPLNAASESSLVSLGKEFW